VVHLQRVAHLQRVELHKHQVELQKNRKENNNQSQNTSDEWYTIQAHKAENERRKSDKVYQNMLRQQRYQNEGRDWEHLQEVFLPILSEIATGGIGSTAEGWTLEPNNLHCFDFVKDNVYEMYMSNPLENTLDVLANKFRLTKSRLAAIIRGKQMELDEASKSTDADKAENWSEMIEFEDEYEEFFVADPIEHIDPPTQKRKRANYIAVDADVNSQAAIETMRHAMRHWGVMQPYILPKDPPPEYADQAKSRILREPYFTPEEKKENAPRKRNSRGW